MRENSVKIERKECEWRLQPPRGVRWHDDEVATRLLDYGA